MNDMMTHVEKIVRPVRAIQSRKLRMRRELLTHLQSALGEELARGIEESTALELAKQRLGEPAELTLSLQKTVPWIERLLLAKMRCRMRSIGGKVRHDLDLGIGSATDDVAYGASDVRGHRAFVRGGFGCDTRHVAPGDSGGGI